jgi:LacI family transcriptional regulator
LNVTINQIAQLAGVSRGTVDRVLNNRGNVKPEVMAHVKGIAAELGYKPNAVAKALVTRKKKYVIGILVNSIGNHFFDEILEGMEAAAESIEDFGILLAIKKIKGYSVEKQLAALEELCAQGINALALTPINDKRIAAKLNEIAGELPVVVFNSDIEGVNKLAFIGSDYYKSGEVAGELMGKIAPPDCKVGIITGSAHMKGHNDRIRGFSDYIEEYFPSITVADIEANNDDEQTSYRVTKRMLQKVPGIAALYFTAGGVEGGLRAAHELGFDKALKIITFDATPAIRKNLESGIISFTLCQQPYRQGYLPVRMLADYLVSGVKPERQNDYMDIEIKVKNNI